MARGLAVKRSRKDSDPDWHHNATSVSPADDLLRETFDEEEELQRKYRRDVEDDMEDILNMPLAKSLQSRRPSQSNLKTYLPTSSSSTSLASFSRLHADDEAGQQDDSGSEQVETLQAASPPPSKLPRSTSPMAITRNSSTRQTSPHLSSPTSKQSRPTANTKANVARKASKGSSSSLPSKRSPANPRAAEASWETLQVAPSSSPTSTRSPSSSPSTTRFPTRTSPDTSTKPSLTPSRASPRVRAQTQNCQAPRPSPRSASASALATLSGPPKPVVKKVQLRQRSFSMSGRRVEEVGPNPPWMDAVPQVFRDERGELGRTGRLDDLVLPAVARRLEAERLAKLEEQGLIASWEKDGTPRGGVYNGRAKRGENGRTPTLEAVEMDPMDGDMGAVEQVGLGEDVREDTKKGDAPRGAKVSNPPEVVKEWPVAAQEPQGTDKVDDAHGGGCCNCSIM